MELVIVSQNVCPACRNLETFMKNEYEEVKYKHVNIDDTPEAIEEYNVMGTPKVLLIDDGDVVSSFTGFNQGKIDDLEILIEQL